MPGDSSETAGRRQLAELLSLPEEQVPPLRIKWSHLERGPQGELLGSCPKVPSDLEARVGYQVDNQDPQKKERVFGYLLNRLKVDRLKTKGQKEDPTAFSLIVFSLPSPENHGY